MKSLLIFSWVMWGLAAFPAHGQTSQPAATGASVDLYSIRATRALSDAERLRWYGAQAPTPFELMCPPPTQWVLQIACPDRSTAGVVADSLVVKQWTDDQGTDLAKGASIDFHPFDLAGTDTCVSVDGHQVLIGLDSPTAASAEAARIVLRGSVKLLIGSDERKVPIAGGNGQFDMGGVPVIMRTFYHGDARAPNVTPADVVLSGPRPLDAIKSVEFLAPNGAAVASMFGTAQRNGRDPPGSTVLHCAIRFPGQVDHAVITYYNKTEELPVPIEMATGIDLLPLPPPAGPAPAPPVRAPATGPTTAGDAPWAEVFSLHIFRTLGDAEQQALFAHPREALFQGNGGYDLAVMVHVPRQTIVGFDPPQRIESLIDDQQNDLLDASSRLRMMLPGRMTDRPAQDDGHSICFRIIGSRRPGANARFITFKGAAAVRVAGGDPVTDPPQPLNLAAHFGAAGAEKLPFGNSALTVLMVTRGVDHNQAIVQIILKPADAAQPVVGVEFSDPAGHPIAAQELGMGPGAPQTSHNLNYVLTTGATAAMAKITYYGKVETVTIPYTLRAGLGTR